MKTYAYIFIISFSIINFVFSQNKDNLNVLYLTGPNPGKYHGYTQQLKVFSNIITSGINEITFNSFWVSPQNFPDKKTLKITDIVIVNMCYAHEKDVHFSSRMIKFLEKNPSILVHCTFHSFWENENYAKWIQTIGMQSRKHDPRRKFIIRKHKNAKKHPIVNFWNNDYFVDSLDELYLSQRFTKNIIPLLEAERIPVRKQRKFTQIITWENKVKKKISSIGIPFPHFRAGLLTPYYQSLIINSILYLSSGKDKKINYNQLGKSQIAIRNNQGLFYTIQTPKRSVNLPNNNPNEIDVGTKLKYKKKREEKFFTAHFKIKNKTVSTNASNNNFGVIIQVLLDDHLIYQTVDLRIGDSHSVNVKLGEAKEIKINVLSIGDLYKGDYYFERSFRKKPSEKISSLNVSKIGFY